MFGIVLNHKLLVYDHVLVTACVSGKSVAKGLFATDLRQIGNSYLTVVLYFKGNSVFLYVYYHLILFFKHHIILFKLQEHGLLFVFLNSPIIL